MHEVIPCELSRGASPDISKPYAKCAHFYFRRAVNALVKSLRRSLLAAAQASLSAIVTTAPAHRHVLGKLLGTHQGKASRGM